MDEAEVKETIDIEEVNQKIETILAILFWLFWLFCLHASQLTSCGCSSGTL